MKTAKIVNVERLLDVAQVLKTKSVFLFGPRQCGKSWLIGHTVKDAHLIDLLSSETFIRLTQHPEYIEEIGELFFLLDYFKKNCPLRRLGNTKQKL